MILFAVALVVFIVQKKRKDAGANATLKSNAFLIIFIVYPSICTHAFQIFECRQFSEEEDVLDADYTISCLRTIHVAFKVIGAFIIATVAVGVPLSMLIFLSWKSSKLTVGAEDSPKVLAVKDALSDGGVGKDIKNINVIRLLRDLHLSDFSFLIKIYKPEWFLWETFDMLRKLTLVGFMVVIDRGGITQCILACFLSFLFFAAHVKAWPYKMVCCCFLAPYSLNAPTSHPRTDNLLPRGRSPTIS
jgi:hypothetical protein